MKFLAKTLFRASATSNPFEKKHIEALQPRSKLLILNLESLCSKRPQATSLLWLENLGMDYGGIF
jgi:hypothetical protein